MPSSRLRTRIANRAKRRGAAAVEFAVVAPLFFLLLGGIIEFGQAFRIEHMLSNATRRATRAAIVDGAITSQLKQNAKTQCAQTLGVNESDVTVVLAINGNTSGDLSQADEGDEISLTVSIPYSKAGVGFYANTFSTSTLSATCTLEHE